MEPIPEMQWSLCTLGGGKLQLQRRPVPKLKSGEVLIKVLASPINPSDIFFMKGAYGDLDMGLTYPSVSGWEGSGIVVANGGGLIGWRVLGKRVAFSVNADDPEFSSYGGCHQ